MHIPVTAENRQFHCFVKAAARQAENRRVEKTLWSFQPQVAQLNVAARSERVQNAPWIKLKLPGLLSCVVGSYAVPGFSNIPRDFHESVKTSTCRKACQCIMSCHLPNHVVCYIHPSHAKATDRLVGEVTIVARHNVRHTIPTLHEDTGGLAQGSKSQRRRAGHVQGGNVESFEKDLEQRRKEPS